MNTLWMRSLVIFLLFLTNLKANDCYVKLTKEEEEKYGLGYEYHLSIARRSFRLFQGIDLMNIPKYWFTLLEVGDMVLSVDKCLIFNENNFNSGIRIGDTFYIHKFLYIIYFDYFSYVSKIKTITVIRKNSIITYSNFLLFQKEKIELIDYFNKLNSYFVKNSILIGTWKKEDSNVMINIKQKENYYSILIFTKSDFIEMNGYIICDLGECSFFDIHNEIFIRASMKRDLLIIYTAKFLRKFDLIGKFSRNDQNTPNILSSKFTTFPNTSKTKK
jgi:hypothetical protein